MGQPAGFLRQAAVLREENDADYVPAVPVADVVAAVCKILYTGSIGDGKIFVCDVENVVKVRTGEEGVAALQDAE